MILVLMTLGCTFVAAVGSALGGGHRFALRTQQFWSRVMLKIFGVKTVLHGALPEVGLLMANHQSYIDIWIVPKFSICVFVAKMEVKKMPLLGWGASSVATVYVDRKDKGSGRKTKKEIAERIRKGRSVIVLPEGTTSSGNGMLPYKPGMFFVAAEERFQIIPVAIFYENPDLAWVGDDNMAGHFFRNFSKISTTAH
ncbi:MAG: 1-acyl-sn-glycerol-3-phosphate acyltransferase, partial [Flavobacteriales bacterium]|nr:1-acyl-sn-glycerol-3-phosphate acyltransferase [Flavobacteriales bacterium]